MRNTAIINLKNLEYNAKKIKIFLKELNSVNTKICAVVKADGYGLGACECANALYRHVDSFAVASVEEGVKLRYSGINKDILVLSPLSEQDFFYAFEYGLTVTVDCMKIIKKLNAYAEGINKAIRVHIKYNTGMNRFGVDDIETLKKMLDYISTSKRIILEGFYSHFACPDDDKMRKDALNKFLLAKIVVKGYNNNVICHISASGGLLSGVTLDMVRVGLLLYGFLPFKTEKIKLKKVLRFYSPVIKVRTVGKGNHVFYGNKKSRKNLRYAITRYGYADGLMRKKRGNLVANRCMDVSAVKINSKTKKRVKFDVDWLARDYGTINYEILTKIGLNRTEKLYRR